MAMLLPFNNVCPSSVSLMPCGVTSLYVSFYAKTVVLLESHYSLTSSRTMSGISTTSEATCNRRQYDRGRLGAKGRTEGDARNQEQGPG